MKTLFVIAPIMPEVSDLKNFSKCLDFLKPEFEIIWADPLQAFEKYSYEAYQVYWQKKIHEAQSKYDGFIGFSLGALILLENLNAFESASKPIILVAPPSQPSPSLRQKLMSVLEISQKGQTETALKGLYSYVFSTKDYQYQKVSASTWETLGARLQFGLTYVLAFDSNVLRENLTPFYQMVGEKSQLVAKEDVFEAPYSHLEVIPKAGMRVLEDNPSFCQTLIRGWLHEKQ